MKMKFQVMSDLHLNTWTNPTMSIDPNTDYIVVTGDIHFHINNTLEYLYQCYLQHGKPIIFCLGNHDVEEVGFEKSTEIAMNFCANHDGLIFIQDNIVKLSDDVQVVGGTLWTDFKLYGEVESCLVEQICKQCHNFHSIPDLEVHTSKQWFEKTSNLIEYAIYNNEWQGKTLVLSHFAPSMDSIAECYRADRFSAYFASDLDRLMGFEGVWVHGHTHISFNYQKGDTTIICNPRGTGHMPNHEFNHKLIITL